MGVSGQLCALATLAHGQRLCYPLKRAPISLKEGLHTLEKRSLVHPGNQTQFLDIQSTNQSLYILCSDVVENYLALNKWLWFPSKTKTDISFVKKGMSSYSVETHWLNAWPVSI